MYLQPVSITSENVTYLLEAAEYFQIADLKNVCVDKLIRQLSVDNCLQLLDTAFKFNIEKLKRLATDLSVPNRKCCGSRSGS
jgi:BTB/POZ domain